MPRPTPFHSRTSALCSSQSWQDWSGFLSANSYELEHTELLPSREALGWGNNWANVYATNTAVAAQAFTVNSIAAASANQTIVVLQG